MIEIDKRKMERFSLQIPAIVQISDKPDSKPIEITTKDVCAGGAFFQTTQSIPIGTEVEVDLVIPINKLKEIDAENVLIKVDGSVIRANNEGMVVSFSNKYNIFPLKK